MIEAKVICDSVSPQGHRLTTFKLRYPRFIHAEFMTHRMLSRNASSSRALPVAKLLEEAGDSGKMALPIKWGTEKRGMQSGDEIAGEDIEAAKEIILDAADYAVSTALALMRLGLHKSICNRYLEPFTHINVVATATEWMNFFGLRLDTAAEPTMRALAEAMWRAYGESKPFDMTFGQWHLPFMADREYTVNRDNDIKVSVARCARVSYESFETGQRSTVDEDLRLYDKLVGAQPIHASPAEHQATPDNALLTFPADEMPKAYYAGINRSIGFAHPEQHGNFVGWRQYRKMLTGEAVAPLPEAHR